MKTHKGLSKRIKITASGKLSHMRNGNNHHLKTNKTARRKNRSESDKTITVTNMSKKIARSL